MVSYPPLIGPDLTKLIPGVIVEKLWGSGKHRRLVARDTTGQIWTKEPGADWVQLDLISLALKGLLPSQQELEWLTKLLPIRT